MLETLRRPLQLHVLAVGSATAVILVAAYCAAYTWLAGRPEAFLESLYWSLANVYPWLLAIEGGKRARGSAAFGAVLIAAASASLGLGYLLGVNGGGVAFELSRRVPSLILAIAGVMLQRSQIGVARESCSSIPLIPGQIDWVRAAGNYIELRAGDRTVIHRSSISAAERDLSRHGFIRIHRSILLRRDHIARVRPRDVVLHDGTHLPIGKRYRASLTS